MKTNTLLLLSLLFLTSAYGQNIDLQVGGNYYFKGNHQIIKDQKGNLKSIYTNYNVYKNTNVLNNTQTIDNLQLEREAVTDEIIKENHVVTIGKKSIINSPLKLFKRERDCVGLKHETTIGPFNGFFNAAIVGTK